VEYVEALEHGHILSSFFTAGAVKGIEWIFLISGGMTVAYMCKLFMAVFVEKNRDREVQKAYDNKKTYMKSVGAIALTMSAAIVPVFGMLPYVTMDTLADMAQNFLEVHHAGHAVHYFTWVNLKGSLISIAIGAALYLTVVRCWMMEEGVYIDRWPKWLDLEEKFYRPLLLKVLPGIFGGVCAILDHVMDLVTKWLPKVGAFLAGLLDGVPAVAVKVLPSLGAGIAGVLDILVDGTVVFLRKTIYRDSPERGELEVVNALTHTIGVFLNLLEALLNKTIWKNHEHKRDLEHWLVLRYTSFKENTSLIERSLSYGLVLFCLGLCATLIYLLVSAFL